MQALSEDRALRGADAIKDFINSRLGGGQPVSRAAVYRMIESQRIPITRLGGKRTEVWSTERKIAVALGLEESPAEPEQVAV